MSAIIEFDCHNYYCVGVPDTENRTRYICLSVCLSPPVCLFCLSRPLPWSSTGHRPGTRPSHSPTTSPFDPRPTTTATRHEHTASKPAATHAPGHTDLSTTPLRATDTPHNATTIRPLHRSTPPTGQPEERHDQRVNVQTLNRGNLPRQTRASPQPRELSLPQRCPSP